LEVFSVVAGLVHDAIDEDDVLLDSFQFLIKFSEWEGLNPAIEFEAFTGYRHKIGFIDLIFKEFNKS